MVAQDGVVDRDRADDDNDDDDDAVKEAAALEAERRDR